MINKSLWPVDPRLMLAIFFLAMAGMLAIPCCVVTYALLMAR